MLRKLLLLAMVCGLAFTQPAAWAQDKFQDNTDLVPVSPGLVLKGMKTARLVVNVSGGAHRELHRVGVSTSQIDEDLLKTATEKLRVLQGLSLTPASGPPGTTQLLIEVITDKQTGVFSVGLVIQELVTLNREPHAQVWLTTWSMAQHPSSNEDGPIRSAVSDLIDQFVDAYLTANELPKPAK